MNKHSIAVLKNAVCPILGVDPIEALKELPLLTLKSVNMDLNVYGADFIRLWERIIVLAGESADPFFLGRAMAHGPVIPIFLAFSSAPNLREALRRLARYKALFGPVTLHLSPKKGGIRMEITSDHDAVVLPPSLAIPIAIFVVEKARSHTARPIVPETISLPSGHVSSDTSRTYFGQSVSESRNVIIEFSAEDSAWPFISENEALWREIEMDLERQLNVKNEGVEFPNHVEVAIRQALNVGPVRAESICEQLGVSRATMQRKLRRHNQAYQGILDKVRQELSFRYLLKSTLKPYEIARLVGFDDPKSFHRAFKKWTGTTPETFRATLPLD
ncbi:AraC family transcriptional regulator [Marinomonas sp. IMCC 4694]|uniref:AraC family transcriptional regulator n=1 Tax=Marinomonas sp. IMCC 4694 TaxID=2605432 RepID=UPI0011E70E44|nr:AraC family transcriptional regulator [Marinomonas sp. IMCC 4694]TYL49164.1 AraC family transcriptional regulator [Marinomonas sp. IMCC 4694]